MTVALIGQTIHGRVGSLFSNTQDTLIGVSAETTAGLIVAMTFTPVRPERRIAIPALRRIIAIPDE